MQAILLISLFVMSLIAGRLLQLQGLQRAAYTQVANSQRETKVTLSAARGRILDRSGNVLADTVAAVDIDADLPLVTNKTRTAAKLAPLLHVPESTLQRDLSVAGDYAMLKGGAAPNLGSRVTKLHLPGIYTAASTRRVYPDGALASNVLGAVGTDGGSAGLEQEYNADLAGRDGFRSYEVGVDGTPIPGAPSETQPARSGETLQLSLQRDIQYEAQRAAATERRVSDAKGVTVIVDNPRNGQILALADAPTYNLNSIDKVKSRHKADRELSDPAVENTYEPGSVNKVITVSAALQDKLITPKTHFVIPGEIYQGGSVFHDAEDHGTEELTTTGILAQSSNIGAIEIARKLGPKRLDHYMLSYGYDKPTGIGLPGEPIGDLPKLKDWSATTMPTVAFGQGLVVSALQVADVYNTIANGGVQVSPSLVEARVEPDGTVVKSPAPTRRRIISQHTAHQLSDMLESVTTADGTAPEAQIKGYRVAGKTGTANIAGKNGHYLSGAYTGSFVGFAPADNPKLVVEVVVHDPRKGPFYGADVAAPVFQRVMSFALQTLHIPPTGTKPPKSQLCWGSTPSLTCVNGSIPQ